MKKASALILVILMFSLILVGCNSKNNFINNTSYLRMHIRANSNEICDQNIKYVIKEKLCNYLTPIVINVKSKEELIRVLTNNLESVENLVNDILKKSHFTYTAKASINNEYFPTRVYGTYTLEANYYDALIVGLGMAQGDNWWCVVYPPLCFSGSSERVEYRSKILEVINNFFNG